MSIPKRIRPIHSHSKWVCCLCQPTAAHMSTSAWFECIVIGSQWSVGFWIDSIKILNRYTTFRKIKCGLRAHTDNNWRFDMVVVLQRQSFLIDNLSTWTYRHSGCCSIGKCSFEGEFLIALLCTNRMIRSNKLTNSILAYTFIDNNTAQPTTF